jgi:hypothetical protein
MRTRLVLPVLAALGISLAPGAGALTSLESQSRSCWTAAAPPVCEYDGVPPESGPGASTSILRTIGSGATTWQGSAAMTVTDYDLFSASAGGSMDYTLGPADEYPSQNRSSWGLAFTRIRDVLTATGAAGAGTIRMQWRVRGTNDIRNDSVDPLVVFDITREVTLDFRCYIDPNFDPDCGNPVLVFEDSGPFDELLTFDLPIAFGVPVPYAFWVEFSARSGFLSSSCLTPCVVDFHGSSTADLSAELVAVELRDGVGTLLDPSGISSESGFRYDLVSAPEPSGGAAAASALLVALARFRRAADRRDRERVSPAR